MNRISVTAIVIALMALSCRTTNRSQDADRQTMTTSAAGRPFPSDLPRDNSDDCSPPGDAWRSPQQNEARVWLKGHPRNLHPTLPIGSKAKVMYQVAGPDVSSDAFWRAHDSSLQASGRPVRKLHTRQSLELRLDDFVDVRQPGQHHFRIKPKSGTGDLRVTSLLVNMVPEPIHQAVEALNKLPRHSVDLVERPSCYPEETAPGKTAARIVKLKKSIAAMGTEVIWQAKAGHYQIARSQFFLERDRVHKADQQCSHASHCTLLKVPARPHCGCPKPDIYIGVTKGALPSIQKRPVNKPEPGELNCPAVGLVCKPPKTPSVSADCVRGWCVAVYK